MMLVVMSSFQSFTSFHAHLVEVLKEIEDTASDLLLVEARTSSVAPDSGDTAHRRRCPCRGERSGNCAAEGRSRV